MRPPTVFLSIVVVLAIGTGALWSFQRSDTSPKESRPNPDSVSLRLNGPFEPRYAGELVARQSGIFERLGLHLDLKPASDANPVTLVSNGTATFGVTRGDIFLVARAKGAPIVAFAAGYLESPVEFYVREKSGIHTPRDFIGKRVARQTGHDTAMIYDAMLARLQISPGQIREISTGTDITAFLNGEVDVWPGHVGKDSLVLQQKGVAYDVIRPTNYGIHVPGTVYFTSEKIIHDHPELVQKFLVAIIAGWNLAYADYTKSVPMILALDEKGVASDQVRFELKDQRDNVLPLGRRFTEFDDSQWKMLLNILIDARLIHDSDSFNLSRAVTYEFLREAYRKPISFGN
jgi:ABC-type nitrate/sulfonate/bicarbonate transport system substrate-binding protein